MRADPVSNWFQAQGISPLVGGAMLGGALIYLLLRAWKPRPKSFDLPRGMGSSPSVGASGDGKEQALELVRAGKKIEAIKLLRKIQGLGLKEAKDLVEVWERER